MSSSQPNRHIFAILGPTGSGKARLARAVAEATGAQLVSSDSMKVYRRMDVGTAKPALAERHLWEGLDLVEPWERFDTSRFVALTERLEAEAPARPLLLSGGTMLYVKAATEGLGEAAPRDEVLREALREEAAAGVDLHARLAEVDPPTAAKVHPNDLRRIVRGLEVYALTGRPQSSFHGQFGRVRAGVSRRVVVVTRGREDMDARIDARVERMLAEGWIAECEALLADPRGLSPEAAQAIGYAELLAWLRAGRPGSEGEVVARIQTQTRRFARKQLTWLRNLAKEAPLNEHPSSKSGEGTVHTLEVAEGEDTLDHLEGVLAWLRA